MENMKKGEPTDNDTTVVYTIAKPTDLATNS